jgi:hypothetical protein
MKTKNVNCLEGFECPKCGILEPFWIDVVVTRSVLMTDEGTIDEESSSTDWDQDSNCRCIACGFEGTVKQFQTRK